MHKAILISTAAFLGLHWAPLAAAPQALGGAAISIDASSEVASALYAASATQEAFARSADARIRELRGQIEALKLDGAAAEAQLADKTREFVTELADRDRAYAQEIAVFREAVVDIASTSEGLNALAMFNDGDELGAIAILDDLRAARDDARQRRADIESASEARRIAVLALEARSLGKLTTEDVIARYVEITELDPGVHWDWVELSRLYRAIGSLPDAKGAAEMAAATSTDSRDRSVALNELGNIQFAQGDLTGALTNYMTSYTIRERLASSDPSNVHWQRDLSISYNYVADIQLAQGDASRALTNYQASHAIRARLADSDPSNTDWQYDLALSYNRLGDVHAELGDLSGALILHEADLAIAERLASSDPSNVRWQRHLSIAHDRIGDVQLAQGDLDGALTNFAANLDIAKRLSDSDPSNAVWLNDLAISYDRIGDLQRSRDEPWIALKYYKYCREIRQRLAELDQSNATWSWALSTTSEKIGNTYVHLGFPSDAFSNYEDSLTIRERIAAVGPLSESWHRSFWMLLYKRAAISNNSEHWSKVVESMEQAKAAGYLVDAEYRYLESARSNSENIK